MSKQAVIFDMGNVVVQWHPEDAVAHLFDTAEQGRAALKDAGFFEWNGAELDGGTSPDEALAKAPEAHRPLFKAYVDNIAIAHERDVAGTADLIERLAAKDHLLLGLTNGAEIAWESYSQRVPALSHLADVAVSGKEKTMKPGADIYLRLLQRNNLTPEQAIFVDDSQANCDGARAVGMDAIRFENAEQLETELISRGLL